MTEKTRSTPEGETVFRLRNEALDWLEVGREVVVLDGQKDVYLNTNPAGAILWKALSEGATNDRLAQILIEEFGIDRTTARIDVTRFLEALKEKGLLVEA